MSAVTVDDEASSAARCDQLQAVAIFAISWLGLHPEVELSITLVDEARMSQLHEEWMDEPGPTDVLSFPMDELRPPAPGAPAQPGVLGDIVLCPTFAATQAVERGRTLDEELQFLVVHGVLHLIGYDHATTEEYEAMFALQDGLLDDWHAQRSAG